MKSLHNKIVILSLFILFMYLFVGQILAVWPFTIDDMYIPLRYAKHWMNGYGLVWNIGERPLEGYSNFSFVVFARFALMLGLNPIIFLKSLGVLGLFLTTIATYQLSRFWFSTQVAIIPCIWLLAYKGEILWSVSGLETTLYQAFLVFSLVFIFKGLGYRLYPVVRCNYGQLFFLIAAFFLVLASLTRPEAPAMMALFAALIVFHEKGIQSNHRWSVLTIFLASFLVLFLPYFFWHIHYFGRIFPNPFYCKGLVNSFDFVLDKAYLKLAGPFLILAIPAVIKAPDRRHYFLWLPSLLYSILLMKASPLVAFDNRLFLPVFVFLLPLALQGIQIIWMYLSKNMNPFFKTIYLPAFLVMILIIPMMTLKGFREFTRNPIAGEVLRSKVLSWLKQNTTSTSRVILADSGFIPYYSDLTFIDSYCLNNADMTRDRGYFISSVRLNPNIQSDNMYLNFCNHIFSTSPEIIILTSLIEQDHVVFTPSDACMASQLQTNTNYELKAIFNTGHQGNFYRYQIYQLKADL
jgi:hypothetical protein